MKTREIAHPSDDYDVKGWLAFYAANPGMRRSIGAAGDDGAAEGTEGGGGEGADAGDADTTAADAGAAAATTTDAGTDTAADTAVVEDWRTGIKDEKLRDYAGKFTTVEELAKSAKTLREKLSKAVNAPGEDATEEEIAEYREKMGVPASADAYEVPEIEGFEVDEAGKAYQGAMATVMHKHNIPNAAFKELAQAHVEYTLNAMKQAKEAEEASFQKQIGESEASLRKEWGPEYKANLQYAEEADTHFFGGEMRGLKLENGTLLGTLPAYIKGMATIGRQNGEGVFHVAPDGDAAASLKEKADAIRAKREEARARGDNAAAQKYDAEERKILGQIYGTK